MEAVEALNIATINVLSVGMMLSGGLIYAFDISSLDDMRRLVRANMGVDGFRTDEDAEKEIEDWVSKTLNLGTKETKRGDGPMDLEAVVSILERIAKLEEEKRRGKAPDEEGKP